MRPLRLQGHVGFTRLLNPILGNSKYGLVHGQGATVSYTKATKAARAGIIGYMKTKGNA